MLKLTLLLWLCAIFRGVQCLNQAMTFELLYYYSAYKMEYAALQPADRNIATKCKAASLQQTLFFFFKNRNLYELQDAKRSSISTTICLPPIFYNIPLN